MLNALAVGRLVPVKNFALLLTAWVQVDIPLQIAGDGPERKDLENLCDALQLNKRVSFMGHQTDVNDLYKNADIVVVPSLREGFGYVTLEALQNKCVVIATPTGLAAEIIPDRYLVENHPSSLADSINWTIRHFDTAREDFFDVWEYARSLTVQKMAEETRGVYDFLLNAN